ncbi:hypothetical protein LTR78_008274 [Recurvomyces mirabilis]|uniref:Phytanoyl-CoA dioxygenase n=1 Tax=Recurvomyces mirabilis TaxID=574656 RepID=A0AAE0WFT8_9PEZI|nr:hypothetical protein LTR78_008274 [Recurvomyces mirabilis]KAK5156559.1 hypothetical protein LTS14_004771 [Recurvomyces mirabilis]
MNGETNGTNGTNGVHKPKYIEGALVPAVHRYGDNPVTIRLSDEELNSDKTNWDTIQEVLKYYHRDGLVVLENAIPEHMIDILYNKIVEDNDRYLNQPHMTWNQGAGPKNVSQVPPLKPEYLYREVYANSHMIRILENLLGPRPEFRFLNSNVACPGGSGRQAVHSDVHHDFPTQPFGVVMNTYLQDSSAANGVTEIWCGTHNAYPKTTDSVHDQQLHAETGWIKKEYIQKQAKIKPPVQPEIKKGSIVFRDLRLWHAGMPNTSSHHRIMLAIDYFAEWYQCPMALKLPSSIRKDVEEKWEISTKGIEWVEGEMDCLEQPFFLNMTQDPSKYIVQTEKGFEDWRARETGRWDFDKGKVGEKNYWTAEE